MTEMDQMLGRKSFGLSEERIAPNAAVCSGDSGFKEERKAYAQNTYPGF